MPLLIAQYTYPSSVTNFIWGVCYLEPHVFFAFHRCIQIKILDIKHDASCSWCGDDAVCQALKSVMSAVGVPTLSG